MVFLANLGVNLHVCLCGDLQAASAQTLDFLDINQKSSFPDWKPGSAGKSFPDGYKRAFSSPASAVSPPFRAVFRFGRGLSTQQSRNLYPLPGSSSEMILLINKGRWPCS